MIRLKKAIIFFLDIFPFLLTKARTKSWAKWLSGRNDEKSSVVTSSYKPAVALNLHRYSRKGRSQPRRRDAKTPEDKSMADGEDHTGETETGPAQAAGIPSPMKSSRIAEPTCIGLDSSRLHTITGKKENGRKTGWSF
jgi:hypothetical protein